MANSIYLILIGILSIKADEFDLEFSDPKELLIAQESRQYQTVVKPPVRILKPNGITNSHRPQYNLDSFEADAWEHTLRPVVKNYKNRNAEGMIRDAVLRALERKDHVGKFAQIFPIVRAMSGNQRVALASLVASQVTTPPGRQPLNLSQVRSMFNNNDTAELMLPILLDTANLIRRSMRPGKEPREVKLPQTLIQRRSFTEDTLDDEMFEIGTQATTPQTIIQKYRNFRNRPQRITLNTTKNELTQDIKNTNNTFVTSEKPKDVLNVGDDNKNLTRLSYSTTEPTKSRFEILSRQDNNTLDLAVEATNTTIVQDAPVAEKLRSLNRYVDRKGNLIRRGVYPKPSTASRRTTVEPTLSPIRRRPLPARTLPANEQNKCELFTNTLCLHSDDYPTEAIVQSIRRNKAAAGALLADFKEPDEGSIDGITAAQEAKYTAEHYLVSNRRGDTSNRDFASAGEAGFMCPSTVKYARPQRARATSGQWKYIVNTGEHTQTLRLEKCLKPKEPCTYLTDNFKSKCVQVYNYHRLLTWDQQNGLHMDIFKVPTCCSCHIEGYSVSFPPLGHRMHETSSEHFPGEDLAPNQAFESVQPSIQRPSVKHPPFLNKPLEFPFNDNSIPDFNKAKISDDEFNNIQNPMDSYGNTYFSDSFNQASSIRNVRRPLSRNPIGLSSDSVTLPSYLEPPTPSSPLLLSKDSVKYKIEQFKRRPNRRPIRKKISSGPEDLISSGSSSVAVINDNLEDDLDETMEESEISIHENFNPRITIAPKLHAVTDKSLDSQMTDDGLKKVNYNYHPIIDFFDGDKSESIDREDNGQTYITPETEWKPINRPITNDKNTNSTSRKKHK